MLRSLLWTVVLVIGASSMPVLAQPVTIEPSTPWNLDYGEARCRAARVFGEGEEKTALIFEQHEPKQTLEWVLTGGALKEMHRSREMTVQFGPVRPPFDLLLSGDSFPGWGKAIRVESLRGDEESDESDEDEDRQFPVGLAQLDPAEGAEIEYLRLTQGKRDLILNFGSLGPIYEAMNACMADLVTHWGADLEREARRAHRPVWKNLPMVARQIQKHYPSGALRQGAQADLHVRIMIDRDGTPTDCRITNLTVAERFNDTACEEIMERAEFEPALDLSGDPMPSFYVTRVIYRIG